MLEANTAAGGGGIYASALQDSSTLECSGCLLTANKATVAHGGGLLASERVRVLLRDSSLRGNRCYGNGAGVACIGCLSLIAANMSVNEGAAGGMGGALFARSFGEARLEGLRAGSCQAAAGGGALAIIDNLRPFTLVDAELTDNRAGSWGGSGGVAVQHGRDTATGERALASGVAAEERPCMVEEVGGGGAMCLRMAAEVLLSDVRIAGNEAAYGGAMMARQAPVCAVRAPVADRADDGCGMRFEAVTFEDNSASAAGSALYMDARVAALFRDCAAADGDGGERAPPGGSSRSCSGVTFESAPGGRSASSLMAGPAATLLPILDAPKWGVSATDLLKLSVRLEVSEHSAPPPPGGQGE